jgi:hypothetical protein
MVMRYHIESVRAQIWHGHAHTRLAHTSITSKHPECHCVSV